MSEVEIIQEEKGQKGTEGQQRATEEFKVQTDQLVKAIKDLLRKGSIRRVTVLRNDRVLLDIPVVAGVAAGVVLATQLPFLSVVTAVAAFATGCTIRIEREEPPQEE